MRQPTVWPAPLPPLILKRRQGGAADRRLLLEFLDEIKALICAGIRFSVKARRAQLLLRPVQSHRAKKGLCESTPAGPLEPPHRRVYLRAKESSAWESPVLPGGWKERWGSLQA